MESIEMLALIRASLVEMSKNDDISTKIFLAMRGARINASRNGLDPRLACIVGDLDSAYVDALPFANNAADGTAAKLTAVLKRPDAPACKYALDRDVTGALPKAMMRVRKGGGNRPQGMAERPSNALAIAKARFRNEVQFFSVSTGKARKASRDAIRTMIRNYREDVDFMSHVAACGWDANYSEAATDAWIAKEEAGMVKL